MIPIGDEPCVRRHRMCAPAYILNIRMITQIIYSEHFLKKVGLSFFCNAAALGSLPQEPNSSIKRRVVEQQRNIINHKNTHTTNERYKYDKVHKQTANTLLQQQKQHVTTNQQRRVVVEGVVRF